MESPGSSDRLVKPADVRESFGIAPSTVRLWDAMGILRPVRRTPGGHRRYWESDVAALVVAMSEAIAS